MTHRIGTTALTGLAAAVCITIVGAPPALAQHISVPRVHVPPPQHPQSPPVHPQRPSNGLGLTGTGGSVATANNYQAPIGRGPGQNGMPLGGNGNPAYVGGGPAINPGYVPNAGGGGFYPNPNASMSFGNALTGAAGLFQGVDLGGMQPQQGYYQQQPQQGYYQQQPQQGYYQQQQPQQFDAFAQQVGGQRFQIPSGYEGYGAGAVINYGGVAYTAAGDGTMTTYTRGYQEVAQPGAGQRYQVPAGYEAYAAGSVINYGGVNYIVAGDGTMTAYTAAAAAPAVDQPGAAAPSPAATQATASGPVSGQRYQVPAQYAGSAAGSIIEYAAYKYLINNDGTMTAMAAGQGGSQEPSKPVAGKRYRIPGEFASSAPGAVITYGNFKYLANNDGTMTAFSE